ncbi:MAG: GEVED domain-containing protein, partial [Bacteroidia bacterium]
MNSKFTSAVKIAIVAAILIVAARTSKAQTQVSEGFDATYAGTTWPNNQLPFGWNSGPMGVATDANNTWERVNAANFTNPAGAPRGGSLGAMRYRSFYCNNVEQSNLTSRPYDLSARPAGVPSNFRFWMYRDPAVQNDNIQLRVHSNPDPTAAGFVLPLDSVSFLSTLNRPMGSAPVVGAAGWYLYGFTIPSSATPGVFPSSSNVYVSFIAQNAGNAGANIYIEDFSITTYPTAQTYTAGNISLVYQNVALVAKNSINNWIIGMKITVTGGGSPITPGTFVFSPNGCTNANPGVDINMTKLWFTGGNNAFPTDASGLEQNAILVASANPGWPVATWSLIPGTGGTAVQLYNGDNYFWLSYNVPAGAISGDYVDADFISAVVGASQVCGTAGCTMTGGRLIDVAYCVPSYTAGTSWLNGSYTDNDYIKNVRITNPLGTDLLFVPFYNDHNTTGPTTVGAGYPADPCVTSTTFINGGLSPFSVHPPDYEKFSTATVANLCSGGSGVRTASFLETSVSPPTYNIEVQAGTWFGSNYIAAFIDLNHDGDFADAQEKIFQSTSMIKLTFQNANFTIPTTYGYFGNTTLRVREWYAQPNIDGCSGGYYGETEDYQITLRPDCLPAGWKVWLG